MGYTPNPLATGLGQQRHFTAKHPISAGIAWINHWPEPDQLRRYREFDLYWQGAHESAGQAGYRLEEFLCNKELSTARLEGILLARGIRAVLIPPQPSKLPPRSNAIHWEKFSVVRLGYSILHPPVHIVTSNQLSNGMLAFDNVCQRGYERIGFISNRATTTRFRAGFLMKQQEIKPKNRVPILMLPGQGDAPINNPPLAAWLKQHRPDAILTDIAEMSKMLKHSGHRVPDDIGLAALTILDGGADAGIYQNSQEIGRTAMELLISLINHNHLGIPQYCREVLIDGKWVDGRSPAPAISLRPLVAKPAPRTSSTYAWQSAGFCGPTSPRNPDFGHNTAPGCNKPLTFRLRASSALIKREAWFAAAPAVSLGCMPSRQNNVRGPRQTDVSPYF